VGVRGYSPWKCFKYYFAVGKFQHSFGRKIFCDVKT
jgi:hypothetical protein